MGNRSFNQPDTVQQLGWDPASCNGSEISFTVDAKTDYVTAYKRGGKTGANTPKYYSRLKTGELLPLNAYHRWDAEGQRQGGYGCTYECTNPTNPTGLTNDNPMIGFRLHDMSLEGPITLPTELPTWDSVNTDALVIAAMANTLPDLDVLTTVLEQGKTIDMVLNARRDAKNLIRQALRGGMHTVKAASDAWMTWRYGWQQLGRDIANIADFINKPITNLVIEGRSGTSDAGSFTYIDGTTWQSVGFDHIHVYDYDISYRANVVGILRVETLNYIANPAISAWETVPYSFVADWFVNIGDVLSAWSAKAYFDRFYCSLGRKLDLTVTGYTQNIREGSNERYTSQSGGGSSHERYSSRTRVPTGMPSLVPSISVELTSPRILDAAAMLAKRIL